MNTPQKAIMMPIILPAKVLGKISPYPTEVRVMITFHMQFMMFVKFYPEHSDIGPSAILSWYPKVKVVMVKEENIN
jgi:hypothetical protein